MIEHQEKAKVTPEDLGSVLHYLVGSKTDELIMEQETLQKIGHDEVNRDDLYIELTIMNMFIMIKQYTGWETNEDVYTKALDQMHFLFFHQLKEHSNYDEDDIERLHEEIFRRYDEYANTIRNSSDANWSKVLSRAFLDHIDDGIEETEVILLAKSIERYYNSIPNLLNSV